MAKAIDLDITEEVRQAQQALEPALARLKKAFKHINPKKIPQGTLVDALYDMRALGKQLASVIAPIDMLVEPMIKGVEEYFIGSLLAGESSGVQGMRSRVQITENVIPVPENWDKFYAHIKKTGEFELLKRAINRDAVRERWANKQSVPGLTKFIAKKVSCTKLGGKA